MTGPTTPRGRLVLALTLTGAVALFLAFVPLHRHWFDLNVYYGAVEHWLRDGRIYDFTIPGADGADYGFTYPPFAALCMLPMALFDWPAAITLSMVLNVAASATLLTWLIGPMVGRHGWPRWFAFVVAACLFVLLEPVRDTFSFGQVNLLLLVLVCFDARLLATGRGRFAGCGIGLAAAVKLTPAIFIGYLLITGRRRAAATATGTAAAATLLALAVAPGASRTYWTEALWDTDRIGVLSYVSNQSWEGLLARLVDPVPPSGAVWGLGALVVLAVWAYRVRRAAAAGDEPAGFALTGVAACLISPITWVHHLVWLIPALAVLVDSGLRPDAPPARRRLLLPVCAVVYVILCSSVVWLWRFDFTGVDGFLGSNAYVWICLGLLIALPLRGADSARLPSHEPYPARIP
ncbi:glycosyltransferase 87 family protein [Streptomyces luomodiensis]|uniref:Glycosyltransferase 87 family protein n=1 Tax=Streptomyces luomodiensis TaxID=3026192 RepID=A0ABY9V9R9_9ACTN|nr:glycosyltransferase 87 family protein [Streptomyces sp. SCA4-21]WNF00620.1 glycosyltransferase 87 family protein [Streptomyces sp. SCA4-21]